MNSMRGTPSAAAQMRIAIASSLALLGMLVLIGCIPIPGPEKAISGADFRKFIDHRSKSPHIGVGIRRSQVEQWLGSPNSAEANGRVVVVYRFESTAGFYLVPLCFTARERHRVRELRLVYDEEGLLQTWSTKDDFTGVNPVGLLPGN